MVDILLKFNPKILLLPHFNQLVYPIRHRWSSVFCEMTKADFQAPQNQHTLRKAYKKFMRVLLAYCKDPKAKVNGIIDLARGYRSQGHIDMTHVRMFFILELPFKTPVERCRDLLENILERIRSRQHIAQQTMTNTEMIY